MHLYLIQHALAKSKEDDPERGLADEGIGELEKTARFFSRLEPAVDAIWHSGKKRARQTADILAGALGREAVVSEHAGLAPMDDVGPAAAVIEKADIGNLVLVGHMPHVSRLASLLLTGDSESGVVLFRNAGIVFLVEGEGKWQVGWVVTPKILKQGA